MSVTVSVNCHDWISVIGTVCISYGDYSLFLNIYGIFVKCGVPIIAELLSSAANYKYYVIRRVELSIEESNVKQITNTNWF